MSMRNRPLVSGSPRRRGAALVLVLIIMSIATITGLSYLANASIGLSACEGHADAARAQQLAESGIQHAICLLRENPAMLAGSGASPLGPFPVDDSDDGYTISVAEASVAGQFEVVCQAVSGRSTRTVAAIVRRVEGVAHTSQHAVLSGGPVMWLPSSIDVDGNLHVNGSAVILGDVDGDVTAAASVFAIGDIDGQIRQNAPVEALPTFNADAYDQYIYGELPGEAIEVTTNLITKGHAIDRGRAVTAANPAGVVVAKPINGSLWLWEKLRFTGTLVVHGDLVIDGWDMDLKAVDGFPAVVATGRVFISGYARGVDIDGMVYAAGGVYPYGNTNNSNVDVNGGVICGVNGFSSSLRGSHRIRYRSEYATLLDPSGSGVGGDVEILTWLE